MTFKKWLLFLHSIGFVLCWISKTTTYISSSSKRSKIRQLRAAGVSLPDFNNNRPHIQRVTQQRPARRLNHAFKYLYRHTFNASDHSSDPLEYLQQHSYSLEQIQHMNRTFPPLLTLSVQQQLHPKMEFLRHTLHIDNPSQVNIMPFYFGARLEKILAPRHAFLVHHQLPHGRALFQNTSRDNSSLLRFDEFMTQARTSKSFAALCQRWQQQYKNNSTTVFTHQQVEAFDALFGRGLMAAARKEWNPSNNSTSLWALEHTTLTAADTIQLLHQHGANIHERDYQGATLLHWASGTGHLEGVQTLVRLGLDVECTAARDGATPLHWAAAGTTAREFGTGGHARVCDYLIQQVADQHSYVNQCTKDGNSPIMWASWSGTLETVQLLAAYGAQAMSVMNRNGCTVAHWAASGGNVDVCRYLHTVLEVDFSVPNHGGNTPLTHAVAFGRSEVVEWLNSVLADSEGDTAALELAQNFVQWQEGDVRRTKILQMLAHDDNAQDDEE